jgi:type II secretory pathway pseudopilin PulG
MRRRQAFTLVEMMVSTALILFVMLLLSQAFIKGVEAFRQLKSLGDLEDHVRSAMIVMKNDLAADHFDHWKLSDYDFGRPDQFETGFHTAHEPPKQGFFRISQGSKSVQEGGPTVTDGDGIPSYIATNHVLHFTVKLHGNRPEDFFSTLLPPGVAFVGFPADDSRYELPANVSTGNRHNYNSQWAEIVYFLHPIQGATANGTQLYALYRRQLLAVTQPMQYQLNFNSRINVNLAPNSPYPPSGSNPYYDISCKGKYQLGSPVNTTWYFNNPWDLTIPERRFATSITPGTLASPPGTLSTIFRSTYPTLAQSTNDPTVAGADVVLTDVVSFCVRIMTADSLANYVQSPQNHPDPFVDLYDTSVLSQLRNPAMQGVFDTWSSKKDDTYDYTAWDPDNPVNLNQVLPVSIPLKVRILALQISLRIWDPKAQNTRQITFVQQM